MNYKDYYKTLGVKKNASEKDIKRAFRKLARKHHPDVNPDDPQAEERFKEVNEAYEVLSDPDKRSKYDRLGADWQRFQHTGGRPGDFDWSRWSAGGAPGGAHVRYGRPEDMEDLFGSSSPFSDFFSQIFGGRAGAARSGATRAGTGGYQYQVQPQRGQDYEQQVEITLQEAYHGTGRILQKEGQRLEVRIPAGAKTGTRVRMTGQGAMGGAGGLAGDLYLRVHVRPDAQFERKNDDLHTTIRASLYTMVLGGEIEVPTMAGNVVLTIPAGTQSGRTFRLRGRGMPKLRQPDQQGNLYAKVEAQLPVNLTPRQRELFEELQQTEAKGEGGKET
jgi:curved DNA-binding protein